MADLISGKSIAMLKEKNMKTKKFSATNAISLGLLALFALITTACTKPVTTDVKKIPANQEYSGFLKDYSKLAPNPNLEGAIKTYVNADAEKNLHRYVAIVVDPVEVYLASDADDTKIPEKTRAAAANYFRAALTQAVADAFPPVDQPGPLVLRLRAAIIGVDAGGAVAAADKPADPNDAVESAANISKVGVEFELIDSVTGERIAAAVDREPLGDGAEVAAGNMLRHEKSLAARHAFDEWAQRLRAFLNDAHELKGDEIKRADESYQPYGESPVK
jgi:hypothetical protein